MFGKIVDGKLIIAGNKIQIKNGWITNPTEEQLRAEGYKEVVYNDKPTYDIENEKLKEKYTDKKKITVNYEIVALTDEEKIATLQSKIIAEENKMTARNIRGALLDITFDKNKIVEIENNIAELRTKVREITDEE